MTLTRRGRAVLYPAAVLTAIVIGWNAPLGVPFAVGLLAYAFVLIGRAFSRLEAQPRRARAGGREHQR